MCLQLPPSLPCQVLDASQTDLSNGESGDTTHGVQACVLASSLQSLLVSCGPALSESEVGQLALDALLDAHRPVLGNAEPFCSL